MSTRVSKNGSECFLAPRVSCSAPASWHRTVGHERIRTERPLWVLLFMHHGKMAACVRPRFPYAEGGIVLCNVSNGLSFSSLESSAECCKLTTAWMLFVLQRTLSAEHWLLPPFPHCCRDLDMLSGKSNLFAPPAVVPSMQPQYSSTLGCPCCSGASRSSSKPWTGARSAWRSPRLPSWRTRRWRRRASRSARGGRLTWTRLSWEGACRRTPS